MDPTDEIVQFNIKLIDCLQIDMMDKKIYLFSHSICQMENDSKC